MLFIFLAKVVLKLFICSKFVRCPKMDVQVAAFVVKSTVIFNVNQFFNVGRNAMGTVLFNCVFFFS